MKRSHRHDLVITPLLQAIITGTLAGLATAALLSLAEYPKAGGAGAAVGMIAALLAWFAYRGQAARTFEALAGIVTQPPPQPEPAPMEATVRIDLLQADDKAGAFIDLPATPEQLRILADGLAAGRQFSQGTWTGSGAPFARSEFEGLRAELLRRNLARWNREGAPAQGVTLTPAGKAVLRHFQTPPPHPGE